MLANADRQGSRRGSWKTRPTRGSGPVTTAVSDVRVVILRLADLQALDATAANSLGEIVEELEHRGITVLLKGIRPEHLRILGVVGALENLAHVNHIFDDLDAAVAHARLHVGRSLVEPS